MLSFLSVNPATNSGAVEVDSVTSRHTFLMVSSGHGDPKAARLTPSGTAPRHPSFLVSGLRSENPSPPRSAPAGPGDQARRATNQTCNHVALDVPRSLPWWKEDGRRALWKASRGLGASFSSVVVLSLPLYRVHMRLPLKRRAAGVKPPSQRNSAAEGPLRGSFGDAQVRRSRNGRELLLGALGG
jgi:hypothetical protein